MRTIILGFLLLVATLGSGCFLAPLEPVVIGRFDSGLPDASTADDAGADGGTDGGPTRDGGIYRGDGGFFDAPATPPFCTRGQWCWQHPTPQGQPLNDVYAVSATEAWAVGDRGATMRLTNGVWTALPSTTELSLNQVWGSGPNDVWALGRNPLSNGNKLLRFDGTGWAIVPQGALPSVHEVSQSAAGELWVVTDGFTTSVPRQLLRWNGTTLVAAPALPAGLEAQSVCVRSPNEVWLTVNDALGSWPPVALYRWDGTTWTLVRREPNGSSRRFDSRVMCPADGVALVKVFEFNTGTYSLLEVAGGQVSSNTSLGSGSLIATSRDVFSVASDGRSVSQWTPTGWQARFTLPADDSMYSVGFDFVGNVGWLANGTPTLSSLNGSAFVPTQPRLGTLNVFVGPPPNPNPRDPTAVFGDGTWGRRSGSGWTFAPTPTLFTGEPLKVSRASLIAGGDAWLVGNAIARYDATAQTITPTFTPVSGGFTAIDSSADGTVWVVGSQVLHYEAGQWQAPPTAPPTVVDGITLSDLSYTAVDVRSANDVMLLANDPAGGRFVSIFYRWDGTTWSAQLSSGTTLSLFDRDTAGDLYVVEGNEIKKRAPAATNWTTVGSVDGYVTRIRVYGPNEIDLVVNSDAGLIFYGWDSDRMAFSPHVPGLGFSWATDIVYGDSTNAGATCWAAGAFGAVLRFEP